MVKGLQAVDFLVEGGRLVMVVGKVLFVAVEVKDFNLPGGQFYTSSCLTLTS